MAHRLNEGTARELAQVLNERFGEPLTNATPRPSARPALCESCGCMSELDTEDEPCSQCRMMSEELR